uniref:Uncharacterized protein LOC114325789 n=1 Tax=Diabrotica virgifera virgifera TaxID=50390 RepID=A0A6P7FZ99_DIAVI
MLSIRKFTWKSCETFTDLANKFFFYVIQKASAQKTQRIDFIFDSYFEQSVKSTEHLRRSKTECIILHSIDDHTKLPKQENKFWGSSRNKILLQQFLKRHIEKQTVLNNYDIVFSTINEDPSTSNIINLIDSQLQRSDVEEADVKIIIHINHAVLNGFENIYLISSDTDVMVLALFFFESFKNLGLKTLWIQGGSGKCTRNIAIHSLARLHGKQVCSILPALHHLTGGDYTSKVGTKARALKENPTQYLQNFARDCSPFSIEKCTKNAEKFLVNITKTVDCNCTSFDELRVWIYKHKNSVIENLPPTSNSIKLHILRAFYVVHIQTNVLNSAMDELDPTSYGFFMDDNLLMPQKVHILIPLAEKLPAGCNCSVCGPRCNCRRLKILCCTFCACMKKNTCTNKQ